MRHNAVSAVLDTAFRKFALAAAVRALPIAALCVLGVLAAWQAQGSIALRDWAGYAVLGALLLAVVAASGAAARPPRALALGAAGLLALAAWDAASLAWTPLPSLGRDEALLVLLYAIVVLLAAIVLRTPAERLLGAGLVVAAVAGVAIATAVELIAAGNVDRVYFFGRLAFPIDYVNAQAAFFLVAFWPAIAIAATRAVPLLFRALALAAAAALAGGWTLVQSKGGAVGIVVSAIVVFAVSRNRLRLAVPFAISVALTAAVSVQLTDPYRALGGPDELSTIHRAGAAELGLVAVALVLGLGYALLDRRVVVAEPVARRAGRITLAALVVAVVAGIAAFFVAVDHPGRFAAEKWRSFKHLPTSRDSGTHLTSLGSNRWDFWRVALDEFAEHPLAGIGVRGFRAAYFEHRRSPESPARAHSFELDALSETGIVGFALLALALGAFAIVLGRRARDDLVACGSLGAFACWAAHASVDWIWSFPAIGIFLFTLVGIGVSREDGAPFAVPVRGALATAAAAAAIGAFGLPWLASRYVSSALDGHADPQSSLDHARSLDPISTDAFLAEWTLAPSARAGIAPLAAAVRQEPRSVELVFALGRQQLLAGDKAAARVTLRRALALDPHDSVVVAAYRKATG